MRYLKDAGFAPLRVIDLSQYQDVARRLSFLAGEINFLLDPSRDLMSYALFGGAVRDAVSGMQSDESDFDFVLGWEEWQGLFSEREIEGLSPGKTYKIPSVLPDIQASPRFRGLKTFMPMEREKKQSWVENDECSPDVFPFHEAATYWHGWGGIRGFMELYFEASFLPSISQKSQLSMALDNVPERMKSKIRKIQLMTPRYTAQPKWSKLNAEDWYASARLIDPIEHTLKTVRMVDLTSSGLIYYRDNLIEAVPGAFADARSQVLRKNPMEGVSFHNTEKRIERLVKRGYKLQ
jgi:hypothetical protein